MLDHRKLVPFAIVLGAVIGCGGNAGGSGGSANSPDEEVSHSGQDDDTAAAPDEEPSAPPDPCASGTCTTCGDAVCLTGFYCEEAVSACGWLPECVETPTCDCIGKVLEGCRCEERAGGVYVDCQ